MWAACTRRWVHGPDPLYNDDQEDGRRESPLVIAPLVALTTYSFRDVEIAAGALEGAFVMTGGALGLLADFSRNRPTARFVDGTHVVWNRGLPPIHYGAVHLFALQGNDRAMYLGLTRVERSWSNRARLMLMTPLPAELVHALSVSPPRLPDPTEAIVCLSAASTSRERIDAMRSFVERWFEPASPPTSESRPEGAVGLPPALATFYDLVEPRAGVAVQNSIVPRDAVEIADGRVVFYVENQGVWSCATAPIGDDPPVNVRFGEHDWRTQSEPLSGFLVQLLLCEAVFGPPYGARGNWVDEDVVRTMRRRLKPVALRPWITGETFVALDGVIGMIAPNGDGFTVLLGARDRRAWEPFESLGAEIDPDLG